jgi:hypothetical protein
MRGLKLMAKQRLWTDRRRGTSKAEVRLAGWGSSLPSEGIDSFPRQAHQKMLPWSKPWETPASASATDHPDGTLDDRIARLMARNDRRHHRRISQPIEISIQQFSPDAALTSEVVPAAVLNVSRGGMCLASHVPFLTSSVLQCQISVPDLQVVIPTLMQVVWFDKIDQTARYAVGLRYLF